MLTRTLSAAFLFLLSCGLGLAFPDPALAMKQKGDLIVRLRAIHVNPDDGGSTSLGPPPVVKSDTVPELDFTYFFTDNIAAELILATAKHSAFVDGVVKVGDVKLLPPTLTLQYHFNPKGRFSPYLGAGINYTWFYDEDASEVGSFKVDDAFGWVAQAGLDIALSQRLFLNVDVKKLWLETDLRTSGPSASADVEIDPWIVGVGIGYRF